jgi:lipid-A-disaccharide synthase
MDKEVVKELIQDELNKKNLSIELSKLLNNETREVILKNYDILEEKLGGIGASEKTAKFIINDIC